MTNMLNVTSSNQRQVVGFNSLSHLVETALITPIKQNISGLSTSDIYDKVIRYLEQEELGHHSVTINEIISQLEGVLTKIDISHINKLAKAICWLKVDYLFKYGDALAKDLGFIQNEINKIFTNDNKDKIKLEILKRLEKDCNDKKFAQLHDWFLQQGKLGLVHRLGTALGNGLATVERALGLDEESYQQSLKEQSYTDDVNAIRKAGYWNFDICDYIIPALVRLSDWPQGKGLCVIRANHCIRYILQGTTLVEEKLPHPGDIVLLITGNVGNEHYEYVREYSLNTIDERVVVHKRSEIPRDGDCLFNALFAGMGIDQTQANVLSWRSKVADHLLAQSDLYIPFIRNGCYEEYDKLIETYKSEKEMLTEQRKKNLLKEIEEIRLGNCIRGFLIYDDILQSIAQLYFINLCIIVDDGSYVRYSHDGQIFHNDQAIPGDVILLTKNSKGGESYDLVTDYNIINNNIQINKAQRFSCGHDNLFRIIAYVLTSGKLEALRGKSSRDICTEVADFLLARIDEIGEFKFTPRPEHSKWHFGTAYYATGMLLSAGHNLTLHDIPPKKQLAHTNEVEPSFYSMDKVPSQPPVNNASPDVLGCLALGSVLAASTNPVIGGAAGVICMAIPAEARPANEMHVDHDVSPIEDTKVEWEGDGGIIEENLETAGDESELVDDSNVTEESEANLSYEQIREILQTGSNSRSRILTLEERLFNLEESVVAKPSAEDFIDNDLIFRPRINQALYNQEAGRNLLKIDIFKKPNSTIEINQDFTSNFVLYELQSDDTEIEVLSPDIRIVMRPDNYGYITVPNLAPGTYIIRARDEQADERVGTERFEILDSNDFVETPKESTEDSINEDLNSDRSNQNDLLNSWQVTCDRLFERSNYALLSICRYFKVSFVPEESALHSMNQELREKNYEFSGNLEALTRWMASGEKVFRERMEQHILSVEQKARDYIRSGQQEFRQYYSAYERMLSKFLSLPAGDYAGKAEITRRLIKLVAWKNSFRNSIFSSENPSERNDVVSGAMLTLPLQTQAALYRKYKLETTVEAIGEPGILNGLDELFAELDRGVLTTTLVSSTTPTVSSSTSHTAATYAETLRYYNLPIQKDSSKESHARIADFFHDAISVINRYYPREIFSTLITSFSELRGADTAEGEDESISLSSTISWIRAVLDRALPELLAVYVIDDSKRSTIETHLRGACDRASYELFNIGNIFRRQYKALPLVVQENIFNNPDVRKFIAIVDPFQVYSASYSVVDNQVNKNTIESMIEAIRLFDLIKTHTEQIVVEYNTSQAGTTSQASITLPSTSPFTRRLNELIISSGQLHKLFSQLQLTESNDVASLIFEIQQLLNIREPSENEVEQFFNRSSFISKAALQRLELPITGHCNSSESYRRINSGLIDAIKLFRLQYPTSLSQSAITAFRRRHSELAETYDRLSEDSANVSWMKIVINETLPELVYISEFYEDTGKRRSLQDIINFVFRNGVLGEVANLFYQFRNQYENLSSRFQASVLNNPDVQRFLAIVEYFKVNSSFRTLYNIANTTLNNNTVENMIEAGSLFKKITNYLEQLVITDTTSSTRPENQQTLSTVSVTATSAEPTSSTSPASQTTINWDTYNDAMYQLVSSAANDKQSNDTLAASRSMLNLPFYLVPRPENMQTPWVIRPRVFVDTPVNGINIDIFSATESGATSQPGATSQGGRASPINEFLVVERRGNQNAYLEVFRLPLARTGFNLKYQLPTPLVEPNASIYRVSVYKAGEIIDGTAILFQHVGNNQFKYLVETEASVSQPATTSPPTVNSNSSLAMQALQDYQAVKQSIFDPVSTLRRIIQSDLDQVNRDSGKRYTLDSRIDTKYYKKGPGLSPRGDAVYKSYSLFELLSGSAIYEIMKNGHGRNTDSTMPNPYYVYCRVLSILRYGDGKFIQHFANKDYESPLVASYNTHHNTVANLRNITDPLRINLLKKHAEAAKGSVTDSKAIAQLNRLAQGENIEVLILGSVDYTHRSLDYVTPSAPYPSATIRNLYATDTRIQAELSGLVALQYDVVLHQNYKIFKYIVLSTITTDFFFVDGISFDKSRSEPEYYVLTDHTISESKVNLISMHSSLYYYNELRQMVGKRRAHGYSKTNWGASGGEYRDIDDILNESQEYYRRTRVTKRIFSMFTNVKKVRVARLANELVTAEHAMVLKNIEFLVRTPAEIEEEVFNNELRDAITSLAMFAAIFVNLIPGVGTILSGILGVAIASSSFAIKLVAIQNLRDNAADSEDADKYGNEVGSEIFGAIIDMALEALPLAGRRGVGFVKAHVKTTTKGIMGISDALSLPMTPIRNLGELANTNPIIFRAINAAGRDTKMIVSTVNQELVAKGFSPRTIFVRGKNGVDDHFATVVRVNDEDMVVDFRLNRISRSSQIEFRGTLNNWWNASGINKNNYDNYLMFNSVDEATQHQKLLNQLAIIERAPTGVARDNLLTKLFGSSQITGFNDYLRAFPQNHGVVSVFKFSQTKDFINNNLKAFRKIGGGHLQDGVCHGLSRMVALEIAMGRNPQEVLAGVKKFAKFADSNKTKKQLIEEINQLHQLQPYYTPNRLVYRSQITRWHQGYGLHQSYQQQKYALQEIRSRVRNMFSNEASSVYTPRDEIAMLISTDSYQSAAGTTGKHTIVVGKRSGMFYYGDVNKGLVTFDNVDDLDRALNYELSHNYGYRAESQFDFEVFTRDPNQPPLGTMQNTPFAKVLSEAKLPQLEASRKFSSAPTETLPDEMQGWLSELRATTDANGASLDNLINAPAGKCEAAMAPVANFMRAKGMTNIQYRGMYIWSNGLDEMPSNHFVVVGTFDNKQYVFDITAAQFATSGMSSIDAPLLLPERAWAYKFNTATTTKFIKYQDYSTIADARHAFASSNIPVSAAKRFTNGVVLSEPRWYQRVKDLDPNVTNLLNKSRQSCGLMRTGGSTCLDLVRSCGNIQKTNQFYASKAFESIRTNLQNRLGTNYSEETVKRLLSEYGTFAKDNDAYKNLTPDKLEAFLLYDLTMSPTQQKYMTRYGWKQTYKEEVAPNLPVNYWRAPRASSNTGTLNIAPDNGQVSLYRTMSLEEANRILGGELGALSGHMGDLKQAASYFTNPATQVVLEFKLAPDAHLKLFTADYCAIGFSGEGTSYVHAVATVRSPGKVVPQASSNEGQLTGFIGVKSENRGEGFSFSIKPGDDVGKNKFKSLLSEVKVVFGSNESLGKSVTEFI